MFKPMQCGGVHKIIMQLDPSGLNYMRNMFNFNDIFNNITQIQNKLQSLTGHKAVRILGSELWSLKIIPRNKCHQTNVKGVRFMPRLNYMRQFNKYYNKCKST